MSSVVGRLCDLYVVINYCTARATAGSKGKLVTLLLEPRECQSSVGAMQGTWVHSVVTGSYNLQFAKAILEGKM